MPSLPPGGVFNSRFWGQWRERVFWTSAVATTPLRFILRWPALLGFAMAGSVRVGLAAGADDYARVRRASLLSVVMAVAAILCIAIPVALAPRAVAGLYLDAADPANAPVIALVAQFLVIATAFMVFDATQVATNQALRGLKDVRWPMVIAGFGYWVVGFPVAAVLGLGAVGAPGVWIGLLASLVTVSALFSVRLYLLVRRR